MPLTDEDQADAFLDQGGAVFTDQDRVLKVSDPPALREQRSGQSSKANQYQEFGSQAFRPKPRSGARM
jgi:hypothetical protein